MFGKISELFDRKFAVGYFLPVATFITANVLLLSSFGLLPIIVNINTSNQIDVLVGTTIIGLLSWLFGVFLLATNRNIIRLFEGYGSMNPARILINLEKWRYKRLQKSIEELDDQYDIYYFEEKEFPSILRHKRDRLMKKQAERFPDDEDWLLPTSFGNTIRSFEVYPRVMYGIESTTGWSRLLAVIPDQYRDLIDNAKVTVDFWINLCFLSFLVLFEYIVCTFYIFKPETLWFPIIPCIIIMIAYSRAKSSAVEWGDLVKSSFDLFLPDLCQKLGFIRPTNLTAEQGLWTEFSQAITFVRPDVMPSRDKRGKRTK